VTTLRVHHDPLQVSERILPRLEALGLCIVTLGTDGQITVTGKATPLHALVAGSMLLAPAWINCPAAATGEPFELWPGATLVPLSSSRRRRLSLTRPAEARCAVLLITPEFLGAEQLHRVCDSRGVDWRATVHSVMNERLPSAAEAQRIAQMITWMRQDSSELDRRDSELHTLSGQLGDSYEELSLLYRLSASMSVNQAPAEFLSDSCSELRQVLGLRWMTLQLIDTDPRLNELAGQTFHAGQIDCDPALLKRIGRQVLAMPEGALPQVSEDVASLGLTHFNRIATNALIVPLTQEHRRLGVLLGGDKIDGSHISSVDSKLCGSLANSLSIFLENTMLYEDMQAMFLGTLHALTAAIDAKDSYTHGHSERVAMLSRQLAQAAGLEPAICERVYVSGLVHDVGKIGVPEAVLCKPGQLTREEFELVKMHPAIGARILQDIRQMQDLIPGVLYHHERWDGKGYPHGLSGQNIPLMGRLIALADSFDAMSSNRTYRQSLEPSVVLSEIRNCAGKQFDPSLVELFVALDFTPFHDAIARHQGRPDPSPGAQS
jgi:HD-GYP domain-containing protein (c-di-GMP phosphodiesterase class II)